MGVKLDIELREEEPQDIDAIFEINKMAFDSGAEASLVNNLRGSKSLFLSLVAIVDGQVVGHIAFSPMKISGFEQLNLIGLAPMAVHANLQKQGVGSKLIRESLSRLKDLSIDAVFLLGHKEYYPKFGFVPSVSNFGIRSKYEVPDDAFMAIELKPSVLKNVEGLIEYSKEFDEL